MLNTNHPAPGQTVLASVISEGRKLLPLEWDARNKVWCLSLKGGELTALYPPADIRWWIDDNDLEEES